MKKLLKRKFVLVPLVTLVLLVVLGVNAALVVSAAPPLTVCPGGGNWTRVNSGHYWGPVAGATEYCFKFGNGAAPGDPGSQCVPENAIYGSGYPGATPASRCPLRHWAYFVPPPPKKVYVCKYVGTPGVDERLQTGQNPIEVSVNAIGSGQWDGVTVPAWFNDAHDRSYVLGFVPMVPEPDISDCPSVFTPPDPITQTIYDADCEDIMAQDQEAVWVGGEGGGYGSWVNVGSPYQVHVWTDLYTLEFWIAPDQSVIDEPAECQIFKTYKKHQAYLADNCEGIQRVVNLYEGPASDPYKTLVGTHYNVTTLFTDPFTLETIPAQFVDIPDAYGSDYTFPAMVEPENCLPEPEECGRCSNVFAGWVEWVDRDGGCDGDYNNERVEYPGDERCVNCDETVAQEPVWGAWVLGLENYGPWQDNGDGTFTRTGTRTDTRSATVNHLDARYETIVCKVTYLGQIHREPISETDDGSEKIKTGRNCVKAWAWVRYFDPDGGKVVNGPKEYYYWLYPYVTEKAVIMGKTIKEKKSCQPDIPDAPGCRKGFSVIKPGVWDAELGEWSNPVCEANCAATPRIIYTIAGNFPCILYGNAKNGDTVYKLPGLVETYMADGTCDLIDRVGCDGVTPIEDAIWKRAASRYFSGVKGDACYEREPCIGCDGNEFIPELPPLVYLEQ